ncbi:hypothetical protein ACFFMR_15530 [Micromonospora andamanensis]|uniref:Integral membrane protein n=1 Tax=Micromonospora andamanensis TaxID=1287068 RepID=A0ABQ4HYF7_9ACTN|nr:hypothetical protein [Micromonospora andamanensis]GIJ10647.1 hypothetical protein Van01_38610 [Micromonospora andamanensis]
MDDAGPRPRPRTAAAPGPEPDPIDFTGGTDGRGLFLNGEFVPWYDDDLPSASEPLSDEELAGPPDRIPWWISRGEQIDATALENQQTLRERFRRLGGPAGYDTFWGFVDTEPVSVLPTVRTAILLRQAAAAQPLDGPRPRPLMVGVVVAAAAAFGIVGGPSVAGLVAAATTLIVGVILATLVLHFAVASRTAALGATVPTVACVAASTAPAVHGTRWYDLLVGVAFAGAGLVAAALWPYARAWRAERLRWSEPDLALVAALLEFGERVESDPLPADRRRAVTELDRAAERFELAWPRVNRTGVDITDRQLRGWAGRIRAETRELQRLCASGTPQRVALLLCTYELIQAIVNRYPLTSHEEGWILHGSWRRPPTSALGRLWARSRQSARYVRQCLLAGLIAIAALLLLAATVWPAVPAFVGTNVSPGLGSALSFDPTVRLFVAGISLSLFPLAGRAFTRRR